MMRKMIATATTTPSFCHFGMGDLEGSSCKLIVKHDNTLAEIAASCAFLTLDAMQFAATASGLTYRGEGRYNL